MDNNLKQEFKHVLFGYNKTTPKSNSYGTLDHVAYILKKNSNTSCLIEGHTDSTGQEAYNLDLSKKRANTVKNYLEGKGVAPSRLRVRGLGDTKPVATNETAKGRQENRRVELSIK